MKKVLLLALMLLSLTVSAQTDSLDEKYGRDLLRQGTKAPDFTLKTADGKDITLSDYRGSYVVLDFWASWCPDCRKDIPQMKELFNQFKDLNVNFVGVSFDTDRAAWINCYWDTYKMYWTQVSELKKWKHGTTTDRLYHVNWIPTMYLIDPDGRVVVGTVDINRLRSYLQKIPVPMLSTDELVDLFPGGKEGFGKYINDNSFYPPLSRRYKATGRFICRFLVAYDGKVSGASVIRVEDFKIGNTKKFNKLTKERQQSVTDRCMTELQNEAIREINSMPNWKPATENGRPVQAQYFMPIEF
jgi:thiol-disulfide isomerase/thioredoxin